MELSNTMIPGIYAGRDASNPAFVRGLDEAVCAMRTALAVYAAEEWLPRTPRLTQREAARRVFDAAIRTGRSRTSMLDTVLDKGGTPAEIIGVHLVREIVRRIGDRVGASGIAASLEAAAQMGLDVDARRLKGDSRGLER